MAINYGKGKNTSTYNLVFRALRRSQTKMYKVKLISPSFSLAVAVRLQQRSWVIHTVYCPGYGGWV